MGSVRVPRRRTGDEGEVRRIKVYSSPLASAPAECGHGNPVLPSTGTKFQTETDYSGSGDLPLEVVRVYSSANPNDSVESYWRLTFGSTMRLDTEQGVGRAIAYFSDRRFVHLLGAKLPS